MDFKDTSHLRYETGDLFLGLDERGREIGVKSDRHALTVAGSGSGKGTCVIIPNLKRYTGNALVIDPKGENARETWKDRLDLGQSVHVIDPFQKSGVPDQFIASFNPLDHVDKDGLTAGSDLLVIADGLIKKSNPDHAEWDETAAKILAGCIGYVLESAPEGKRTITEARDVLLQAADDLRDDAVNMMLSEAFDGLVRDAGNMIVTALDSERSLESQALSQAKRQTQWVGMKAFRNVLETSTFKLSDLKTGKATVFLVLPPEYLDAHGAFLKMFVQSAINAMVQGQANTDTRCLFILDEFYSLGRMDSIMKGFGLLRGYGVQLWPILQDLGQLIQTYTKDGMATFLGNSDVHQFFGTTDDLTLDHIATQLGTVGAEELDLPDAPSVPMSSGMSMGRGVASLGSLSPRGKSNPALGIMGGLISAGEGLVSGARQAMHQNEVANYQQEMQQAMARVGRMRMPPDEVGQHIQRPTGGGVARSMICFVSGTGAISLKPAPYFEKRDPAPEKSGRPLKMGVHSDTKFYISVYLIASIIVDAIWWNIITPNLNLGIAGHFSWQWGFVLDDLGISDVVTQIVVMAAILGAIGFGIWSKKYVVGWVLALLIAISPLITDQRPYRERVLRPTLFTTADAVTFGMVKALR